MTPKKAACFLQFIILTRITKSFYKNVIWNVEKWPHNLFSHFNTSQIMFWMINVSNVYKYVKPFNTHIFNY